MPAKSASDSLNGSDAHNGDIQKKKKRSKFRFIGYVLILLLGLYVCSLFALNTNWAKSKITNKISQKSNLEWSCGRVMWVPFSDISLHDIKTKLGSGGLEVETIEVTPDWKAMLKGELAYDAIQVDGVNLDIDELWLEEYLKKQTVKAIAQKKAVAQQAKPKPGLPKKAKPPVIAPNKPPAKPVVKKKPKLIQEPPEKTKWLDISNVNVTVRRGGDVLKKLENIRLKVPINGPKKEGYLELAHENRSSLSADKYHIPIQWEKGQLSINHEVVEVLGMKWDINAAVAIRHKLKIFMCQIRLLEQSIAMDSPYPNLKVHLKAKTAKAEFRLEGSLTNPRSWLGNGRIYAEGVSIKEDQKTHSKQEFDHVGAAFTYIGGNLIIRRAEASSYDLVIFMNGVMQKNLYGYGVVRVIATSRMADKFNRIYHGSKAIYLNHRRYEVLEPLNNPDRKYCDIRFDGKITDLKIKHNRSDNWESFNQTLLALKKFKNEELEEDGLLVPE